MAFERSKKRIQTWKRALFHFCLCFVVGFFIGFAPSGTTYSVFSNNNNQVAAYQAMRLQTTSPEGAVHADKAGLQVQTFDRDATTTLTSQAAVESATFTTGREQNNMSAEDQVAAVAAEESAPRRLLVLITTTTRTGDPLQGALLRRLGQTLRLVAPPLVWIVVESQSEAPRTAEMLRKTGVMYRHLVLKEKINFTEEHGAAEVDHQRNVALGHVENHRLDGIVHFASLSNVYDLRFFDMIRQTEVFGAWPTASVSATRKRVALEGPVCSASRIAGWHVPEDDAAGSRRSTTTPKIDVSGFAFNSSILWDPERWGRPTSLPDISQDSIKFVQEVVFEDDSKLKAMPLPDCSRILMWRLHVPRQALLAVRSK